jgi:hypothetical protein
MPVLQEKNAILALRDALMNGRRVSTGKDAKEE